MHVDELKLRCRKNYYRKGVPGGDDNTSLGILIKVEIFFNFVDFVRIILFLVVQ